MSERPFLTAHWRDLVMLTWAVPDHVLAPHLGDGIELDRWHGRALASVVAFRFERIRVRGVAIPGHTAFPEVNLRFYVRRPMPDGTVRRGVVFIEEMVPRRLVALVARTLYGEPYVARPMREAHLDGPHDPDGPVRRTFAYEWRRDGSWERVLAIAEGAPRAMRRGSLEEFIAEHYWGYRPTRGAPTMEYRVAHPPWEIRPIADAMLEADVAAWYGSPWAAVLSEPPISSFVAEGSDVAVFPGRRLPRGPSPVVAPAAAARPPGV
jgi:uncharacterized protein YqjF (DUF2071 family)